MSSRLKEAELCESKNDPSSVSTYSREDSFLCGRPHPRRGSRLFTPSDKEDHVGMLAIARHTIGPAFGGPIGTVA